MSFISLWALCRLFLLNYLDCWSYYLNLFYMTIDRLLLDFFKKRVQVVLCSGALLFPRVIRDRLNGLTDLPHG